MDKEHSDNVRTMKMIDSIDKMLSSFMVSLADVKKCVEDNEQYIEELESRVRKYESAVKAITECDVSDAYSKGGAAFVLANVIRDVQKKLEEIPKMSVLKDAAIEVYGMTAGYEIPKEITNIAVAKKSGIILSKQSAEELRTILIRYANAMMANEQEDMDPRYATEEKRLGDWVKVLDLEIRNINANEKESKNQ